MSEEHQDDVEAAAEAALDEFETWLESSTGTAQFPTERLRENASCWFQYGMYRGIWLERGLTTLPPRGDTEQCTSSRHGLRCSRSRGHDGEHWAPAVGWGGSDPRRVAYAPWGGWFDTGDSTARWLRAWHRSVYRYAISLALMVAERSATSLDIEELRTARRFQRCHERFDVAYNRWCDSVQSTIPPGEPDRNLIEKLAADPEAMRRFNAKLPRPDPPVLPEGAEEKLRGAAQMIDDAYGAAIAEGLFYEEDDAGGSHAMSASLRDLADTIGRRRP